MPETEIDNISKQLNLGLAIKDDDVASGSAALTEENLLSATARSLTEKLNSIRAKEDVDDLLTSVS